MLLRTGMITALLLILWISPSIGQITSQVTLAGYNHRPIVKTPAVGFATLTLEGDTLYVQGNFQDLRGGYWAAYIHYGETGKRGHPMLKLKAEISSDKKSGTLHREANKFLLTESLKIALRKEQLYINISSSRFQHGEIRGQIPSM